jgi:hypothetical protein
MIIDAHGGARGGGSAAEEGAPERAGAQREAGGGPEPASALELVEWLLSKMERRWDHVLVPLAPLELRKLVARLEERDPELAMELALVLARSGAEPSERWRRWRHALPPLLAVAEGGRLLVLTLRSWTVLERALFPPSEVPSGLAAFATLAGRRHLVLVYEVSGRERPPLAWCSAAPPSGCVVTVYRKAVKLGACAVADRVGWLPDLGARPDRGEVLKALLRGASALGGGGRLLLALPRPEAQQLRLALSSWLGFQPYTALATKRREFLLLDPYAIP